MAKLCKAPKMTLKKAAVKALYKAPVKSIKRK